MEKKQIGLFCGTMTLAGFAFFGNARPVEADCSHEEAGTLYECICDLPETGESKVKGCVNAVYGWCTNDGACGS